MSTLIQKINSLIELAKKKNLKIVTRLQEIRLQIIKYKEVKGYILAELEQFQYILNLA
jgi:hypothetical protein